MVSPGIGVECDLAAVAFDDDAPGDVEPEPRALADVLRREERLERPLLHVGGHAVTAVDDVDHDVVAVDARVDSRSVPWPSIASIALSMRLVHTWFSSAAYASRRGTSAPKCTFDLDVDASFGASITRVLSIPSWMSMRCSAARSICEYDFTASTRCEMRLVVSVSSDSNDDA